MHCISVIDFLFKKGPIGSSNAPASSLPPPQWISMETKGANGYKSDWLTGYWTDQFGSRYYLTPDYHRGVNVLKLCRNGSHRFTRSLVRYNHKENEWRWGQSYKPSKNSTRESLQWIPAGKNNLRTYYCYLLFAIVGTYNLLGFFVDSFYTYGISWFINFISGPVVCS